MVSLGQCFGKGPARQFGLECFMQLQSEVAGTGVSEGQLDISFSGFLHAVCGSSRQGLLVAWHLQGCGSSPTVAQGSRKSVLVKRADMKFYDWLFQVVLCLPFATGWTVTKAQSHSRRELDSVSWWGVWPSLENVIDHIPLPHPLLSVPPAQYTEVFGEMGRHFPLT